MFEKLENDTKNLMDIVTADTAAGCMRPEQDIWNESNSAEGTTKAS